MRSRLERSAPGQHFAQDPWLGSVNCKDHKEPLSKEPGADVVTDLLSSVAQSAPPTAGSVPSEECPFAAEPSSFIFQKKKPLCFLEQAPSFNCEQQFVLC